MQKNIKQTKNRKNYDTEINAQRGESSEKIS